MSHLKSVFVEKEQKEEILIWVLCRFKEKGIRSVTMDEIAAHSGISKRTLYEQYDGATRGESKFFISFWKEYADYIECLGSNILNIYDPEVTISNNIITIKGKRRYEPLSLYYYSFIYKNNNFYYNSILGIHRDADDNTTSKYYFSSDNKSVNINSIFADKLIKDE